MEQSKLFSNLDVYIESDGKWGRPLDESTQIGMQTCFSDLCRRLLFMAALDTGWTGMIFETADRRWCIIKDDNWTRVVNVGKVG